MAVYTRRVQTILSEQEFQQLTRLSEDLGKPVSVLIREAVEQVYFEPAQIERRRDALKNLLALQAPVSDWSAMEKEILNGVGNP